MGDKKMWKTHKFDKVLMASKILNSIHSLESKILEYFFSTI